MLNDQHQCIHLLDETETQEKKNLITVDNIWLKDVPQI
jgi:hypothetical protein